MATHHERVRSEAPDEHTSHACIDPVCGMSVEPVHAAGTYVHHGETYYFCSQSCLDRFAAAPEQFTGTTTDGPPQRTPAPATGDAAEYTCPMHPEVRQTGPGSCPKCGMALEPVTLSVPTTTVEYTCPMHPEIVRGEPGFCPICGMALEPRTVTVEEENLELKDMTRRFWVSLALSTPLLVLAMAEMVVGASVPYLISGRFFTWLQFALATPVVLWGGWPFFVRGWVSVVNRSLNMFTLIGLGVGTAYGYSVVATFVPDIFPHAFRGHG